jgi:hypothetical protein
VDAWKEAPQTYEASVAYKRCGDEHASTDNGQRTPDTGQDPVCMRSPPLIPLNCDLRLKLSLRSERRVLVWTERFWAAWTEAQSKYRNTS